VTIDTGASATVARPDIVAGLPERELSRPYVLQTASGETILVVKEAHVELTMGRRTLRSWVFVADIKDDFILGLDFVRAYDASVDIGRRVLRLGQDEVPVREAPTETVLKRTRPTENRWNGRPVCWQCGRTGHLWRGCPRGPAKERVGGSDWRRDCATGGRSEARRLMAESARTPPGLIHQSDEKQRLDACAAALEGQNEELKAKVAELEAALERKVEATTEILKEEGSEAECQRRITCRRVRIVAAAAPDDRERAAPRRGSLPAIEWKLARTVGSIRQESLKMIACGRTARLGKGSCQSVTRIDNAAPPVENDGGTLGQIGAVPGGCSGRAALRRGQMSHVRQRNATMKTNVSTTRATMKQTQQCKQAVIGFHRRITINSTV
jgi:predicted aspartyl protease